MGLGIGRFFKRNLGTIGDVVSVANPIAGKILKTAFKIGKKGKATDAVVNGISALMGNDEWSDVEFINKYKSDKEFAHELVKLEKENEGEWRKLHIEDLESARETEIERIKHGSWLTANINTILAIFFSVLFGSVLVYVLMHPQTTENAILLQLFELLKMIVLSVVGYYFGSSKGSKDKANTIHRHIGRQ